MSLTSKMPLQVWILTLAAFAIGTAEFVIAGILTQVAEGLGISEGKAGNLITAYALAIVIGGPILTLWLARFGKRKVLIGLMALFVVANLITALTSDYHVLLMSRVLAGLTQGPFYGIGAVVATRLVGKELEGQAVGQMFAGLTLANVLGVPGGAWIGNLYGWQVPFMVVAGLGVLTAIAIMLAIPRQGADAHQSVREQIGAFRDRNLQASLLITVLGWVGFMTFYGYIAPVAEQVAGFERSSLTWLLIIVGFGLVIGNSLGGKSADTNLRRALIGWPAAMIAALIVIGLVAPFKWPFVVAAFVFGVVSFANVPPMQMRVMKFGSTAPELAATANISAFNIANALGGLIGGAVIDSSFGAAAIPFAAAIVPVIGLLFILSQEHKPAPVACNA
ncbi:MFS transporter [Phaeovulum vinaykumarii]|uniref:MFS transporter, DHA1 family, inner membrane transport protein n=1 Tax=Phaeovulum vinaykumarii TaxID=407234 RepID=A0A1N7N0R3_9RHOB|nr:MFS transporter [Phaeovulum vinaykumarii]SIS91924.1 MFS transporter, DHA1 family, inner membrane transport protein [Phaeovulum vinaykumarii]SOC17880.1 DHA1 family inner membrane transport protein [Phaeovulum vinaykumarii]